MSAFRKGDRVVYVPTHARGDATHKDCQHGVVARLSDARDIVFVKYDNAVMKMTTGDEPYTPQATSPNDLVFEAQALSARALIRRPPLNELLQIPFEEYNADTTAIRSGWFSHLARSPAHLAAHLRGETEDSSDAKDFGQLLHCFVLEPDRVHERYYREPPADRRTKRGKQLLEEAAAANPGKIGFRPETFDLGLKLRDSVFANKAARAALQPHDAAAEQSMFWLNAEVGELCKVRYDIIAPQSAFFTDVKSTLDASESAFERSIFNFGYDRQSAHYFEPVGLRDLFVCVEKRPPYACAVYAASDEMLDFGRRRRLPLLRLYAECRTSGRWPSYPQIIRRIGVPRWARV